MRLPTLALGAALLSLLGGCVIYDGVAKESVHVTTATSSARVHEALEPVRMASVDNRSLSLQVASNGCTDESSFEVLIKDGDVAEIRVKRLQEDVCRAIVPDGTVVSWTFDQLGIKSGQKLLILNPLKP